MRNDAVTTTPCPVCGDTFTPIGRRRYCSDACRQKAVRTRHQPAAVTRADPGAVTGRSRLDGTIYECGDCGQRYSAQQWCQDCNRPCTRIGPGGPCPHCDEPVTLDELLPRPPMITPAEQSRGPVTTSPPHDAALNPEPQPKQERQKTWGASE